MRLPQIGGIVLYNSPQLLKQLPAIIMMVDDRVNTDIRLNLSVFGGRGSSFGTILSLELGVVQGNQVGQWQWPDMPPLNDSAA